MRSSFAPVLVSLALCTVPLYAINIQVEGPQDSLAGAPTINHCTLRKAVINSNDDAATYPQCQAGSGTDTIEFLSPMTVTFALAGANEETAHTGDLDITSNIIIDGGGSTIDGAALDRVFHVHTGATLTINNLWIRNGSGNDGGGAIEVDGGTLNLNNVTISGSHAPNGDGGAIWVRNGGVVHMTNCTVTGNSAAFHAGAIVIEGGVATFTSCTITSNASGFSNLTGGIRNTGTASLRNTIVAGNAGVNIPNLDGTFTSLGYNVIGNLGTDPANPTIVAAAGDQIGASDAAVNLGPLQDNGGPTPTRALLAGSIALDHGHSSGTTTDQRGLTRPCDDAAIANPAGGDGADVGAYEEQVACSNTPPEAHADSATIAEDSGANSINVLANDTDANGDTLSITSVTQGVHGSVTNNGTSVSYTPAHDFFGSDSFSYTIDDGHSATSAAVVSVTITDVEDAPDAVDDSTTVAEDTTSNVINVLANDVDVDGDTLNVTAVTQGAHGTVVNNGVSVAYTPAHDFFGADAFTYTISDGRGGSDSTTVQVIVTNVNDPPVAAADSYSINQDTTLAPAAPGVLANDTDVDADVLHALPASGASHGVVSLNANGSFVYTPNAGFAGTDSFAYRANDGTVNSNLATVTIHIADTEPPVITSSIASTILWPPNHTFWTVGLTFSAVDNSTAAATSLAVYSNEDAPGAASMSTGSLRLRAEREGNGDGRVYLIIITATDTFGNSSHACLTAGVPKSQSAAAQVSLAAQASAARAQCVASGLAPPGYVLVSN